MLTHQLFSQMHRTQRNLNWPQRWFTKYWIISLGQLLHLFLWMFKRSQTCLILFVGVLCLQSLCRNPFLMLKTCLPSPNPSGGMLDHMQPSVLLQIICWMYRRSWLLIVDQIASQVPTLKGEHLHFCPPPLKYIYIYIMTLLHWLPNIAVFRIHWLGIDLHMSASFTYACVLGCNLQYMCCVKVCPYSILVHLSPTCLVSLLAYMWQVCVKGSKPI